LVELTFTVIGALTVMGTFKELPLIATSLVADSTSFDVVLAFVVDENFSLLFQLRQLTQFLLSLFTP
jgi:hypothetical protein